MTTLPADVRHVSRDEWAFHLDRLIAATPPGQRRARPTQLRALARLMTAGGLLSVRSGDGAWAMGPMVERHTYHRALGWATRRRLLHCAHHHGGPPGWTARYIATLPAEET